MAVYETSLSRQKAGVGPGWARETVTQFAIVAMTTAMLDNANDDVGLFWVPAGAIVTGYSFRATDMDSGTALVIDVGDAADEDRFIAASTAGQTGAAVVSAMLTTGYLYKFTADTQVRAYINVAAGTPVAGTLYFSMSYVIDPDYSVTALVATI